MPAIGKKAVALNGIFSGTEVNVFKYYVDAVNGLDTNDGLTIDTAWKTITKVNSTPFVAGDSIGFKKGQILSGVLTPASGESGNPIIYGSYGSGARPKIVENIAIIIDNKSNIIIKDIDTEGTWGCYIPAGASNNIQIKNLKNTGVGGVCICAAAVDNLTFDNVENVNGAYGIYAYGANSANISVTNSEFTKGGIDIRNCENVVLQNNTILNTELNYNAISLTSCTGSLNCQNNLIDYGNNLLFSIADCLFINGNIGNTVIKNSTGDAFSIFNSSGLTISNSVLYKNSTGVKIFGTSHNINIINALALENSVDGFITGDSAHDITFKYCRASKNGIITNNSSDGFTCHGTNYNINFIYCIADYNISSGWCVVGSSQGLIYGCLSYKNAKDYTLDGGVDQVRGGFTFYIDGVNPVNANPWKMRNCIGFDNYPRELYVDRRYSMIDIDYNQYKALNDASFADINAGGSNINWATYHALYEDHSVYADPLIISDILLYPTTALVIGEDLGTAYDDGIAISSNWGNATNVPVIVTKQQGAGWQIGAYVK